jgi:hypothetical protein
VIESPPSEHDQLRDAAVQIRDLTRERNRLQMRFDYVTRHERGNVFLAFVAGMGFGSALVVLSRYFNLWEMT